MRGFFMKALSIDLSARTWREEDIPESVCRDFLGGKGLGTWLLIEHNPPGVDPLSPDNHLIFTTGPLTDLRVHGSARYGVFTKSPLTGLYTESYSGGTIADRISRTGYDAIMISGASDSPVYLEISDKGVEFRDASDLRGMDAYATEDAVKSAMGDPRAAVVVIGPAGEAMVRFATINNNYWRCAGRTGAGAVMGSKKLKAVVFSGDQRRPFHDEALLEKHWADMKGRAGDNLSVKTYKKYGTVNMVAVANEAGVFPTRYWQRGRRDDYLEKLSGEAHHKRCEVTAKACPRCFMACGNLSVVREGKHKGLRIEGPEYETIYAFGGLCLIDGIEEIAYLNDLCDRLGMDTITSGNLVAFAMLASERGAVREKIEFGDSEAAAELLGKIARREGIGAILAEGIVHAGLEWGMEDDAVHVKGMEPAGYDPRVLKGMGLAYAVSDRGACHLRTTFYKPELAGMIAPDAIEGKAELFLDFEDRCTLFDSLILCRFFRDMLMWDELALLVSASTGMELDKAGLRRIAANIMDLTRTFNLREGMTRDMDALPKAIYNNRLQPDGQGITPDELNSMISDYYRLRGWDQDGAPPSRR